MSSKREDLKIDFDDLGLEEVINKSSKKSSFSDKEKKAIAEASEDAGFPSRQAKSTGRRKRMKSPYTEQLGFKARPEVKAIFQELSDTMEIYDHTTFEMAVIALLEKCKKHEFIDKLNKIIK